MLACEGHLGGRGLAGVAGGGREDLTPRFLEREGHARLRRRSHLRGRCEGHGQATLPSLLADDLLHDVAVPAASNDARQLALCQDVSDRGAVRLNEARSHLSGPACSLRRLARFPSARVTFGPALAFLGSDEVSADCVVAARGACVGSSAPFPCLRGPSSFEARDSDEVFFCEKGTPTSGG